MAMMRRLIIDVVSPAAMLALSVYFRAVDDGDHQYHPWEIRWVIWIAAVIVLSMMVGAGLRSFEFDAAHLLADRESHRPFDHDAVQLAADESVPDA